MPIYEYSCKKCGKTIEVIQKMSDPELKKHQGCGGTLTKLISAAGFQFKGSGWYVTDYGRKSESSREGTAAKETQETGAKKDGESKEKKPAATTSSDGGTTTAPKPSAETKPPKSSGKKD
jgi:putative FmdB family regulatory protein